jgi:hypothetical protein
MHRLHKILLNHFVTSRRVNVVKSPAFLRQARDKNRYKQLVKIRQTNSVF